MSVGSVGSIDPTAKQALVDHLLAHSIKHGDFTLKSGRKSPYFLDSKQTACDPDGVVLMADAALGVIPDYATAIGGITVGAPGSSHAGSLRARPARSKITCRASE